MRCSPYSWGSEYLTPRWWCYWGEFRRCAFAGGSMSLRERVLRFQKPSAVSSALLLIYSLTVSTHLLLQPYQIYICCNVPHPLPQWCGLSSLWDLSLLPTSCLDHGISHSSRKVTNTSHSAGRGPAGWVHLLLCCPVMPLLPSLAATWVFILHWP